MGNKRTLVVKTGSTAVFARIFIDGRSVWHGVLNADDAHQVKIPHNVGNVTVFFANTSSAELIIGGKKLNITNKTMPNAARTITFLFAHKNAVKIMKIILSTIKIMRLSRQNKIKRIIKRIQRMKI